MLRARILVLSFVLILCTACQGEATGPRLVAQNTLDPLPTLIEVDPTTAEVAPTITSPAPGVTSERMSPMNVITVQADYVLVTPTLPPSKTPTRTPTLTTTPPITLTPTITVTSSMTAPTFPTPIFSPTVAMVSNPINELCMSQWQFIQPPPAGCPFAPATVGQGVYQTFERGHMFWVAPREIYVLYTDGTTPYWTRFDDTFLEGTGNFPLSPWKDPWFDDPTNPEACPGNGRWQPVRGFGKLWRNEDQNPYKAVVRGRVGCGTMEFEQIYSAYKQTRTDGTVFINDSNGRYYQLTPGGGWQMYAGATSPYVNPASSLSAPNIPLPW
jgi:hypothetical protein